MASFNSVVLLASTPPLAGGRAGAGALDTVDNVYNYGERRGEGGRGEGGRDNSA